DGFFHTGDLGRLDADGALHFVGRLKDVIKTAGANVAAAEVEAVLLEHPAVAAAYVVSVSDSPPGENVAAFVVLAAAVTEGGLMAARGRGPAGHLQGAGEAVGGGRGRAPDQGERQGGQGRAA